MPDYLSIDRGGRNLSISESNALGAVGTRADVTLGGWPVRPEAALFAIELARMVLG